MNLEHVMAISSTLHYEIGTCHGDFFEPCTVNLEHVTVISSTPHDQIGTCHGNLFAL